MIPLAWVFYAWVAAVAVFGFLALLTLMTTIRYGLSCSWTYLFSGLFIASSLAIVFLTFSYASQLDLTQALDFASLF